MAKTYTLRRGSGDAGRYQIDYARELNQEQHDVVMAGGGPLLVIAGAGTGKTRTLTYRVARLIESGVPADRLLLLTFTNRAAREMVRRVESLLRIDARTLWGGTFHSIGRRLLRECADRLGYPTNFGILDREDAESLTKQCIANAEVPRGTRFPRASTILRVLEKTQRGAKTVRDVLLEDYPQFSGELARIEQVLVAYQSRKFECGVMDFDDLLHLWRRVMVENDDIRERFARRFEHVLVDEFQDTNAIQCELVDLMASGHGNLMVVGDDCQSIYSFRGAEFRNILEFPERYPACQVQRLETNYRSTPQVLALANRSIARNVRQFPKALQAVRGPGPFPAMVTCRTEGEQAAFIANRILDLAEEDVPLDRIAVLYRAHWHSMELQVELERMNIPFVIRSGVRFFEQRHIKDLLAFLRFVDNPQDELAFQRVAGLGDGIGTKSAQKLYRAVRAAGGVRDALASDVTDRVAPSRGREGWRTIRKVLADIASPALAKDPAGAIDRAMNGFYETYATRAYDNATNRLREVETLANYASQYDSIDGFLSSLALSGGMTGVDAGPGGDEEKESVVLSTIHQSKGLEFHAVFVLWLADDRFPSSRSLESEASFEEERRLFYVATTRAEQELYLTRPMQVWDRREGLIVLRESAFVREIDEPGSPVFERWDLRQS